LKRIGEPIAQAKGSQLKSLQEKAKLTGRMGGEGGRGEVGEKGRVEGRREAADWQSAYELSLYLRQEERLVQIALLLKCRRGKKTTVTLRVRN